MEFDKESQKPVLPKDLFRNGLTWMFYEMSKHRFPWVVSCLCLVAGWVVLYGSNYIYEDVSLGSMISTFLWMLALLLPFSWLHISKLHTKNMTELVQQVLESNPGLDIGKWDEIANSLNSSFYQEHIWNTPYFFYDGQGLQLVFKANVLRPYLEGKLDDITDTDKIKSANCYLQSLNEKFELLLKNNLPEPVLNSKLPRDTHRYKLFFYPQSLIFGFFICYFQGLTWFMILPEIKRKTLFALIMIMYYQYMSLIFYWSLYRFMYPQMDIIQAMKCLAIIAKVNPGKELDKWDQISKYMNQYLTEEEKNGLFKNRFFDGKHCLDFYETCFEPLSFSNSSLAYGELKEIVEIVQPNVNGETN
ncbi:hypothetical protein ZYGR_0BH00110 [Zygosaccharomyces rouxii]|uniref:Uncharacterized protein n=1 Tax=Zygosaccharomyces rouxii TaxID=4956 RepID=A0A1Q3AL48_ZYGRO|nr:hypothetical protein ZYGR_0BH00110 [Zygosaccharomyces rouxii]